MRLRPGSDGPLSELSLPQGPAKGFDARGADHKKRLARQLREAIRHRGVRRVARESGLSVGLVCGIASGKCRPSERSLQRLRKAL